MQQVLPVFSKDIFGTILPNDQDGALALGLMMAATGVGGLTGAIFATGLAEYPKKGWLMMGGAVAMCLCFLVFAGTSLWMPLQPAFWMAVAMLIAGNIGAMLFQVTNNTIVQARVPDQYRGRVMSVLMMSFGTMPLGVVPVTMAADAWGAPMAIIVAQLVGLGVVGIIFGGVMLDCRKRGANPWGWLPALIAVPTAAVIAYLLMRRPTETTDGS